ncbi:IQ motif-containing protein H [Alosa pseudoharengus]|uniref:IQ motif-containing protein H n=1 Tax=Alosa pseudoharengus TaxID=34774 RepID=UPI003F8C4A4F
MAEIFKKGDALGRVLVQVQDDLKQLKRSLHRITLQDGGETLGIQALETAIQRTECGIQRHAEEYLKSVNKHILTLPCIENLESNIVQIPQWRPPLESLPVRPHKKDKNVGPSPGQKHKAAFTLRLLSNPVHPKIRDVMYQNYAIQFPELPKRTANTAHLRLMVRCLGLAHPLRPPSPTNVWRCTGEPASFPSPVCQQCPAMSSSVQQCPVQQCPAMSSNVQQCPVQPCPAMSSNVQQCPAMSSSVQQCAVSSSVQQCAMSSSVQKCPAMCNVQHKFPFVILDGHTDRLGSDFLRFREHYCLCGGALQDALDRLERLLRRFAVPMALVSGERLADLVQSGVLEFRGQGGGAGAGGHGCRLSGVESRLLQTLENEEEVRGLVGHLGRRYWGEGGREAAAVRLQACWRRHRARLAYLAHRRSRWAVATIALSWLMHAQLSRVRRALQERRLRSLHNCRHRAKYLAENWKHISTSRRTIIHIPSLGYTQEQRFNLWGLFNIMQNSQMGRLCDVLDENVEVIYVAPKPLGEDLSHYYTRLLSLHRAVQLGNPDAPKDPCANRVTFVTPEAWQYFPTHNMCLSTILWHSPRTLRRIRNLIQGRQAYIVGWVPHPDDLLVAEELDLPILGPEPAVAQLYGTKSGGRRVFTSAGVPVPPGQRDIYTLQQLHETLAHLITDHLEVQRWLFKMDGELGGRGTAVCDVCHLGSLEWAQQQRARHKPQHWDTEWAKEEVLNKFLEEVPQLLARHARPTNTRVFHTWAQFLDHFLRYGGVVEAYPPSESVTCLTVDLLVQPAGEVCVLCCGDQLHGPSGLEVLGSSVPQTSVCPEALHQLCTRVGSSCLDRGILGYLSIDLVTFLQPGTMEQQVWAIDLDLGYSNQLAMTQLTLAMSGGTLDCRTSRLEVPLPSPVTSRYVVIGSRLLHTNLSMVHYSVFFQMCKAQGIGFDIKERQGTLFGLHDSAERYSLGMVTVCEDLEGSLMTFARNLAVIHQEISAPNMQGVSNFKDLIKEIEGVLGLTIQNKTQEKKEDQTDALTSTDQD